MISVQNPLLPLNGNKNMENRKSGFRIDMEDEGPGSYIRTGSSHIQKKLEARRIDKLNRRITWIALLIPCLAGAIIFYAYMDFKQRFDNINNNGNTELKTVVKGLENELAQLNLKYTGIEKSLEQKEQKDNPYNEVFLAYEKTTGSLEKSLEKIQERINKIDMAKPDKTSIDASVNTLKEELRKLSENIEKTNTDVSMINERINNELSTQIQAISGEIQASNEALKTFREKISQDLDQGLAKLDEPGNISKQELEILAKEIKQVKKDVVDVLGDTIDSKTLNSALRKQERANKKEIDFIVKSLGDKEDSIRALKRSVQNLETRIKSLSRKQMGTPEPGKVLEQDL